MDIRIEGLRIDRQGRTLLDIPDLAIRESRVTAILGPNGAGKTTFLRVVAGLERPTAGSIHHAGQVAYAFQEAVFLRATMQRNLELGLALRGVAKGERADRARQAAADFGVGHILGRYPRGLSGGELQRFNFARACSLRAPVTLFDEPMSGIDGQARDRLLDELPALLRKFARTVLLVSHDRYEAFRLADDLVLLVGGKVRAAGPKGEVFRNPPDADLARMLGYTLLDHPSGLVAIPPQGLGVGTGRYTFGLLVEQVVDLGSHREALGTVGQTRLAVALPADRPPPVSGETIEIACDTAVTFDARQVAHEPR
ncbi:MAG: ATP-binding cassette domain-containing protein [Candidatus Sericytochromatia bacterium]|nr:ATP-binding cassette domain-containing protein [Candidatus Tanganyikabacteria bacterium]